jgi:hypothetical protein
MTSQIVLRVVGIIVILLGATGLINNTRRGRRYVEMFGNVGARIIYVVIGGGLIITSFFI